MSAVPFQSRITLRDIAQKLGVSHVTVSLALRNAPQISEARRKQVQETARVMAYRPNPMATALGQLRSTGKARAVSAELAWINHWPRPQDIHKYKEFELYWKGAQATAHWYGYNLEEYVCDRHFSLARLAKVLLARNVPGILIPPHNPLPAGWDAFPWQNFSSVRFGHSIVTPRVPVVTSDQTTNGLLAFARMRAYGYRRVGFATTTVVRTRFKAGFLMAQLGLEPAEQVPLYFRDEAVEDLDDKPLKAWLKKYKPDAVLTDISVMPALLKRAGYRVPHDIGLATLSIHDGNVDAGIDQNPEEIGRAAVEMLISQINAGHIGVPKICRELLIEGEWVDGPMLPPRVSSL